MNDFDDRSDFDELDSLPREMEPPPEVEERVVSALKERGLIRGRSARRMAPWWQLAAAALIAATLGWMGRGLLEPAAPPTVAQHEFLLLLSEPEALETTKPEAELIEEYRNWAIDLGRQGRLVSANKLEGRDELLRPASAAAASSPSATGLDTISGFFVVRAGSWDEALALARTCPHLAYGGNISVRMIEDTG